MRTKNKNLQRMYYMKKELGLLNSCGVGKLVVKDIDTFQTLVSENEVTFLIPAGLTNLLIDMSIFSKRLSKIGEISKAQTLDSLIENGIRLYVGRSSERGFSYEGIWLDLAYCPAGTLELKDRKKTINIPEPFFISDTKITQSLWKACRPYESVDFSEFSPGADQEHLYPTVGMNFKDAHYFVQKLNDWLGLESFVEIGDFSSVWEDEENDDEDDEDDEDDDGYGYKEDDMRIGTDLKVESTNILANGFRIPTLDEWEYAAIAGQPELLYPGSNNWDEICEPLGSEISKSVALKLKTKNPNAWHVYDMCHSVFEFTNNLLEYHLGEEGDLEMNAKVFFHKDNADDPCISITKYNNRKNKNFMWISRTGPNLIYSVCGHNQNIGFRVMIPAKTILKGAFQK